MRTKTTTEETYLQQTSNTTAAESAGDQTIAKSPRSNHALTTMLAARLGLGLLLIGAAIAPEIAYAQSEPPSDGSEFDELVEVLIGWITGSLGKVIALAAFLVGMAIGVVKQSAMAAVTGIGIAAALVYVPNVIDLMFGA